MSNKKHTAVDWIEAYLKTYTSFNLYKIIEKAKEIEKQQIMDAYNSDRPLLSCFEDGSAAKEYYKEIYETSN